MNSNVDISVENTSNRIANFSAGPASIPTEVLLKAQKEMLDWRGKGISIMEMSHRSADYIKIAEKAEQDLRDLMVIPNNYKVMFLQGGATLQFSAIPLNLMKQGGVVDYLDTGAWSTKAIKEAQRYEKLGLGAVNVVASAKDNNYTSIPSIHEWQLSKDADYFHYCANETIHGLQLFDLPEKILTSNVPVIVDMSSCILSQPIDVSQFGMIYAGAQKNIGPAGLVIVIIREDLLGHANEWCPSLLNYEVQAKAGSMSNTPATYSWYLSGLVFEWLKQQGGVNAVSVTNMNKAQLLYDAIDNSTLYCNNIDKSYRSIMNVPFNLTNTDLESVFLTESQKEGLLFLKGHRVVGGMRASIYNAVSLDWVEQLVAFMRKFESDHG